jgi:hypothetical protein
MPTRLAAIARRHRRRPGKPLTASERQDWQDIEDLRAELHQLRALLAAVVDGQPEAAGPTIEAARAYLARAARPRRSGNGRRPGHGGEA